jgi:hypothetical protein
MANEGSQIDYVIKVRGRLDPARRSYFEALEITTEEGLTTITGRVPDQSALHGVLARVRDLGLPLVSLACGDFDTTPGGAG